MLRKERLPLPPLGVTIAIKQENCKRTSENRVVHLVGDAEFMKRSTKSTVSCPSELIQDTARTENSRIYFINVYFFLCCTRDVRSVHAMLCICTAAARLLTLFETQP